MMDAPAAYRMVENLAPGTWVAINTEEERIIASDPDFNVLYGQVKGWDNAKPPLILCVPDPTLTLVL